MSDAPYNVWEYYKRQYGTLEALTNYYSELLEKRPDLEQARHNIIIASSYIDAEMEKLDE